MNREQAHLRSAAKYNEKGHVRKAIAHFGRAIHYRAQQFGGLPPCKYGAGCYRKNPAHFEQFSHPDHSPSGGDPHGDLERRIKTAPVVTDKRYKQVWDLSGSSGYEGVDKAIQEASRKRGSMTGPADDAPICSERGQCTILADEHIREFRH